MEPSQHAEPANALPADTVAAPTLTPEAFLAELDATAAGGKGDGAPAGDAAAAAGGEKPADGASEAAAAAEGGDKPAGDAAAAGEPATGDAAAGAAGTDADPAKPEPGAETAAERNARKIFAAAARKEAAALAAEKRAKETTARLERLEKLLEGAKDDPLPLFEVLGFGQGVEKDVFKDLAQRIIKRGEKPAPTPEDRIAALEKQLADEKVNRELAEKQALVTRYRAQVADAVKAAGDKFDLVNAFEAHELVWDVMKDYHAQHGVALDPLVAAEYVEKDLASKVGRSSKFKAPVGAPAASAAKPIPSNGKPPASAAKGKSETITATESGSTTTEEELPMDDHEARARAVSKELGLPYVSN